MCILLTNCDGTLDAEFKLVPIFCLLVISPFAFTPWMSFCTKPTSNYHCEITGTALWTRFCIEMQVDDKNDILASYSVAWYWQ